MFVARRPKSETRHVLEWEDREVTSICGFVRVEVPIIEPFEHGGGKRGCGHCAKKLAGYLKKLRGAA